MIPATVPADGGIPCDLAMAKKRPGVPQDVPRDETSVGPLDFTWVAKLRQEHRERWRKEAKRRKKLEEAEAKAARKAARKAWRPPYDPARLPLEFSDTLEQARVEALREAVWEATPRFRRVESYGRKMIAMASDTYGPGSSTWVEIDTISENDLREML